MTCLDKHGQVLGEDRHTCSIPDHFKGLIRDVYRRGLLDQDGNRVRNWEELQDEGVYTFSEDFPLDERVTELQGRADNHVKQEEEMLEVTMMQCVNDCAQFEDMHSLSALRKLYNTSDHIALGRSKEILELVEAPALWESANTLAHSLLPQLASSDTLFEFDAVVRARCKKGDVVILVEHKTTLDTENC